MCTCVVVAAWTVAEYDNYGAISYWLSHGMISIDVYNGVMNNCNLSHIGPLAARATNLFNVNDERLGDDDGNGDDDGVCNQFINSAMEMLGNINIYDIYADVCPASGKVTACAFLC